VSEPERPGNLKDALAEIARLRAEVDDLHAALQACTQAAADEAAAGGNR
jgi:hypothetical protein